MKLLVSIAICCFALFANAQSIVLKSLNGELLNNDTISIEASFEEYDITFDFKVYNTSDASMDVTLDRIEEDVLPNTSSYFCWSICTGVMTTGDYPSFTSPDYVSMSSNPSATGTTSHFTFHHDPNFQIGRSLYKLKFYDYNNPLDSSVVYCELITRANLNVEEKKINPVVFPNPATDFIQIYNSLELLKITDLAGKEFDIDFINLEKLSISHLTAGHYFLHFNDGSVERFIKK